MSVKRKHQDEGSVTNNDVYRSAPLEDRSSTFIGLFSPSLKPKELQGLADIQTASHKILGWRKESNQQSITKAKQYVTSSDDDGEKYGGKRIEKVLESLRVEGSCCVARWYGGVMLGPVRFEHMETVAKEAIERWKEQEAESRVKKQRLEQEEAERMKLVAALSARDKSIAVLRTLAVEKEDRLKFVPEQGKQEAGRIADEQKPASQTVPPGAAPQLATPIDYTAMPVERLRALDRARDATISFLLKRIDKAEAELKSSAEGKDKVP